MAVGFGNIDNFQDTIKATIDDGILRARANLPKGDSEKFCLECGEPIPEARRKALKGVKFCIECQSLKDVKTFSGYNRRGSKDSQLR